MKDLIQVQINELMNTIARLSSKMINESKTNKSCNSINKMNRKGVRKRS